MLATAPGLLAQNGSAGENTSELILWIIAAVLVIAGIFALVLPRLSGRST
jgi:hypothetical protein